MKRDITITNDLKGLELIWNVLLMVTDPDWTHALVNPDPQPVTNFVDVTRGWRAISEGSQECIIVRIDRNHDQQEHFAGQVVEQAERAGCYVDLDHSWTEQYENLPSYRYLIITAESPHNEIGAIGT